MAGGRNDAISLDSTEIDAPCAGNGPWPIPKAAPVAMIMAARAGAQDASSASSSQTHPSGFWQAARSFEKRKKWWPEMQQHEPRDRSVFLTGQITTETLPPHHRWASRRQAPMKGALQTQQTSLWCGHSTAVTLTRSLPATPLPCLARTNTQPIRSEFECRALST